MRTVCDALNPSEANVDEPAPVKPKGRPRKKDNSREPSHWEHTDKFYGINQHPIRQRGAPRSRKIAASQGVDTNSTDDDQNDSKNTQPNTFQPSSYPQPSPSQPSTSQPSFYQPSYNQPSYYQPSYDQPSTYQPSYDQPSTYQPSPYQYPYSFQQSQTQNSPVQPPSSQARGYSRYIDQFEPFMIPYIENVVDVDPDGNCGFRAVAYFIYGNEDEWPAVREECYIELSRNKDLYRRIFGVQDVSKQLDQFAFYADTEVAPQRYWMDLPDHGHVIATVFSCIFVSLDIRGGHTFLPVRGQPYDGQPLNTIVVGCVKLGTVQHFVALEMTDNDSFPLPAVAPFWERERENSAADFILPYVGRISNYAEIREKILRDKNKQPNDEVINLD